MFMPVYITCRMNNNDTAPVRWLAHAARDMGTYFFYLVGIAPCSFSTTAIDIPCPYHTPSPTTPLPLPHAFPSRTPLPTTTLPLSHSFPYRTPSPITLLSLPYPFAYHTPPPATPPLPTTPLPLSHTFRYHTPSVTTPLVQERLLVGMSVTIGLASTSIPLYKMDCITGPYAQL